MKYGINIEQGDILLVPFPYTDFSEFKKRPVVVLSKNEDLEHNDDIIVCPLTTNLTSAKYSVIITPDNLVRGYLPSVSRIKVNKLFSIHKSNVLNYIAKIKPSTFTEIKKEFRNLI
ncbi:type II toxin-antitoxin system PemK/MazF family toxin [Candidatus Woesearchaeota archaeon]|nr:type II toxin-antitoxin system PemK/MazF family toxin [Candidatus Woesearchaeota archaeon]